MKLWSLIIPLELRYTRTVRLEAYLWKS